MTNIVMPSTEPRPGIQMEHVGSGTGSLVADLEMTPPAGQIAFEPDDVLFGKLRPYLAKSWLVDRPAHGTGEFLCLRPSAGFDARFLNYITMSRPWLDAAVQTSYGSKMPRTSWDLLANVPIPDPKESEQRRIADFLDERVTRIDQISAARGAQIASMDDLIRSEMAASLLVGRDWVPLARLIADERAGLWGNEEGVAAVNVRVARVADFDRREFLLGDVPTVRSAPSSHVQARLLMVGDVLLEKSGGTNLNPVGCPAFVAHLDTPMVCSNFVTRLRPAPDADGRYLALVLGALYSTRQQEPHSTQTTGIQNLSTNSYFRTLVPNRTLADQKRVAHAADQDLADVRRQQVRLERSITLLQEYKQSLVTAAVTGEFDVTTASTTIPESR